MGLRILTILNITLIQEDLWIFLGEIVLGQVFFDPDKLQG